MNGGQKREKQEKKEEELLLHNAGHGTAKRKNSRRQLLFQRASLSAGAGRMGFKSNISKKRAAAAAARRDRQPGWSATEPSVTPPLPTLQGSDAKLSLRAIPPCITSLPHHGRRQSNDGVGDQCAVFGVGR